jgi:hypothetical protein
MKPASGNLIDRKQEKGGREGGHPREYQASGFRLKKRAVQRYIAGQWTTNVIKNAVHSMSSLAVIWLSLTLGPTYDRHA